MHSFSDNCSLSVAISLARTCEERYRQARYTCLCYPCSCCQPAAGCHAVGSHRFLCRFMWTPIPSPVAAGTSGGSLSELTSLMMFLQPLTWQTIANRNEPGATAAGSASVQSGWGCYRHSNIKQHCVPSPLSTDIPLNCWSLLFFFFPWPVWTKWSNPGELI